MRIRDYSPATQAPPEPPVRVLIFYDEAGWAWWHRAHHVKKNMSPSVQIDILKVQEPFDHHEYAFILLFDAQLIDYMRHVPREKLILGSSCPALAGDAIRILNAENCAAGLVNNLEVYATYQASARLYCCQNGVDENLFVPGGQAPAEWVACWVGNSKSVGNKGLDLIRAACREAGVPLLAWDKADLGPGEKPLSQEEVRDRIYHRAAFFICASEFEGTPNPMLESMACGLPTVTTRVGNAPELIRDGYNGFLVDRTVESLAQGIRRLIACDRAALARNARESILAGWTWRLQARKYEAAFLELARERRAHGQRNPKTGYRHVLWVDASPRAGAWDPAPWFASLRGLYPQAAFSVCCIDPVRERYAAVPGLVSLIPFDPERAVRDTEYRSNLAVRLQGVKADLTINASSRPDTLGHLLTMTSNTSERVVDRAFLESLPTPLQDELRPLYTRLLSCSPGLQGIEGHARELIRAMGGSDAASRPMPAAAGWEPRPSGPRVLLVSHMFPPYWFAGVEVYTWHLAKALRNRGWDVSVLHPLLVSGKSNAEILPSSYGGVPVHTLIHNGAENSVFNLEHKVIDPLFADFLDRERFAIVHFQHTIGLSFRMIEIAHAKGTHPCMTLHDLWMACQRVHLYVEGEHRLCEGPDSAAKCAQCAVGGNWVRLSEADRATLTLGFGLRQQKSRDCLSLLRHIVSPTRYVADRFAAYGLVPPGRIEVNPLGLEPVARRSARRAPGGPVRFGFLGTIHQLKNVYLLARCFKQVRGGATLAFHGLGLEPNVNRLVAEIDGDPRMSYAGKYGPDDLADILAGLDMVIVCSITENYPLVAREALSAGVPVIASRVGGIPEIVADGRTGILFDPSRPDDLVEAMQRMVDEPGRIDALRFAIGPVKTMEAEADEWLARYGEMLSQDRNPALPGKAMPLPARPQK